MRQPRYAGNTDASTDQKRVKDSLAALDAFFRDVPERVGLPPDRVLFTLDGFRSAAAAQAGPGTLFRPDAPRLHREGRGATATR